MTLNFFGVEDGQMISSEVPFYPRGYIFVDGTNGNDGYDGFHHDSAKRTIQGAVDMLEAFSAVLIAPGTYSERVVIPRYSSQSGALLHHIALVSMGKSHDADIQNPSAETTTLANHADDVYLIGLDIEAPSAGNGLVNYGSRLTAKHCKIEGGSTACELVVGTDAQHTANTEGIAGDCLFEDCEFCWSGNGVGLVASDFGAVTQAKFKNCRFHNLSASSFFEAGGSASVRFRNLLIQGCTFEPLEDGTDPTAYILLNGDNDNTGLVANCVFPTSISSSLNLVSTALLWVGNFHPAGLSTAQPS